ncbi:MAG: sugar phosphate isomerase/epimerase [Verrucomicrobiae bacterium]|nr:sugar phosphate isomerase/epimerase [Verrucomicrobiae bacterium]
MAKSTSSTNRIEAAGTREEWLARRTSPTLSRRAFVARATAAVAATTLSPLVWRASARTQPVRMTLCLSPGAIGVQADQLETIRLAAKHGFTAVEPFAQFLAGLDDSKREELVGDLKTKGIAWGAAGLPVDFRGDDARFEQGLAELPRLAAALQRCGATRVGTWISPGHNTLDKDANFERHQQRLKKVAQVLKDHGLRLGLEYVGTPSLRARSKHPFLYNLSGTRALIAAIGTGNIGLVLDSWHWWTAGDTEAELLGLRNEDVVAVDLNDAPAGLTLEQQQDGQRELPTATGVIPVAKFLTALRQIGCDAPIRAEPFNKSLNDLENDAACAATIAALRKAMALIESSPTR